MTRGRKGREERLEALRDVLRVLNDQGALEESPLGAVPAMVRRAERDYKRRTCAIGQAIADTLKEKLAEIAEDLNGTAVGELAGRLAAGRPQVEVAAILGISTQHLTRRY